MNNRKYSITILLVLSISIVGFIGLANLAVAKTGSGVHPLEEVALMDLTNENFVERDLSEVTGVDPSNTPIAVGETITVWCSDDGLGIEYEQIFVTVYDGTHCSILIEKEAFDAYDLVNDEYVFPNPANIWRIEDRISTADLNYMGNEFDDNMYPTVTTIYGEPLARGVDGQKVLILIFNIRDNTYYPTPLGEPEPNSYIAGYFSAGTNAEEEANIIHIDSYNWEDRVGPGVDRPYLYEGTVAHEFEHLVHFDIDPDEPSWVDEGLADLAGFFCGYGHSEGHVAYYIVYHPITALTFWGSGLEDYGASYLFQLYLYEHFGGAPFSSALVQEQANGIEGIENTLAAFGYSETFDEIFDAWTIANYIDDTRKDGGKYGYYTLDIGTTDSWGYTIPYVLQYMWWGSPDEAPFTYPSYWYGDPQPYTATYYQFTNKRAATVWLDGADFAGTLAYSGTYEWYSDAEAWAWRSFSHTFDIPAGGATLNFMTYFEIEEDWDYGYVEVYDKVTLEWYTLDAAGTVKTLPFRQDNLNTPVEREPMTYNDTSRWHAFTGVSNGWIHVSMDLTPFAGHAIDLYFTTWQDGAFTLQMMYVDEIAIPEIGFIDDVEAGEGDWTEAGWYVTDGILDNGWGVTVIDTKWVPNERYPEPPRNNAMTLHSINTMFVDPGTQSGYLKVSATSGHSGRLKVAIVANHADHILPSGYMYEVK